MSSAAASRDAFMPRRPRGLGMGFVLAVLAHVLLILALAFGVNWRSRQVQGIEAELWSAVPQIAAPRQVAPEPVPVVKPRAPEPPPRPVAKPEPPPPDPQIAIEQAKKEQALREQQAREAEQRQRQKQERERQEQAQREQAQRDALEKQQRELQEKKRQQQELLAQKALRDDQLKRMMNQVDGTGAPTDNGSARRSSGPSAGYAGRIRARIKPNVIYQDQISGNPTTVVEIRVAPDGTIVSDRLIRSSGVKAFDDAVLRGIEKTAVLPRDIDGTIPSVMQIEYRPNE